MTLRKSSLVPLLVAVLSVGVALYVTLPILSSNDWNPSVLIKFPEQKPLQMDYGAAMLGQVIPAPGDGHDGKFYFMQAMDPFYLVPQEHAHLLDRPSYRAQRMLYPTIAGVLGFLPPTQTAWNLWGLNMLAIGVGGWLTARLAQQMGLSAWLGFAFVVNPGVLIAGLIDTAEVVAMVFFVGAALALTRRRYAIGAILLAGAALSRETMILAAVGAIAYIWKTERKMHPVMLVPFAACAVWWLYLRSRIGYLDAGIQDVQALGFPFKGFVEAMGLWLTTPGMLDDLLVGVVLLTLSLLIAWHAWRRPTLLGYMTAGFAFVAITMVADVWKFYFDASRALAPVITVYILSVPTTVRERSPDALEALT